MSSFIILADLTCDLSKEIREGFGVKDYIRGHISFDGRDLPTTLDWETLSRNEFYSALSDKKKEISTAPASPEEYYEIFKRYASEGHDLLSMSISSKISSTFNVAKAAADRVAAEFPERRIYCFDSLRMSGAFGLLVAYAHQMQAHGSTMDEVVSWLEENKSRVHQMGPIDDLMFVARRGRISKGKAIMGSFAGVKPMGDCNSDGYVTVLSKAKGIKKALAATAEYLKLCAEDIENNYVFIMHSDREAYAYTLKREIESRMSPKGIFVSDVFCGSGTNVGPGMIGVYFLGAPVSEECAAEKEMLISALDSVK